MKNMRKMMAVALSAAMVLALGACGGESTSSNSSTQSGSTSTDGKVYNIGICQQLEHPALDAATEGFEAALKDKLGDNVKFDLQNAQNEQANASTIANNFVSGNVDLILANATLALQACAAATTDIPILGTSVTDYATALEMSDWSGATGRNISGTSDLAPLDEQENMLVELFPDAKNVAILYCSAEANSKYQATEFEKYLDEDSISYKEFTASDSNDIGSVVQSAIEYADVIYIPTDNTMAQNTEAINNIALPAGVPIIAGEEGICSGCGVATLSISYYDIGYKAGEMAYDILVNGADITTMNVESAPQVTKEYNKDICDQLGITIPDDYTAIETEYFPVCISDEVSLVKVHLITGKTHQIRAHLAYEKHPLAGDAKYGDKTFNRYFKEKYGIKNQMLHAYELAIPKAISSNMNIDNAADKDNAYINDTGEMCIRTNVPDGFIKVLKGENLWQHGTQEDLEALH